MGHMQIKRGRLGMFYVENLCYKMHEMSQVIFLELWELFRSTQLYPSKIPVNEILLAILPCSPVKLSSEGDTALSVTVCSKCDWIWILVSSFQFLYC